MPRTMIGDSRDLLAELAGWVALETPSTDPAAVNRLADVAEDELGRAGAGITRVPGQAGAGDTLMARSPGAGPAILVLAHLDTVWPTGTLATMPYRVEGDRAHGPGIYDMKAGSFIAFHVLRSLLRQGIATRRPIALMLTPDEEVGSPASRTRIEAEARRCCCALVLEPAGPGGACCTARKGVGRFTFRITGRGAHAGNAFADGASAVSELARQILAVGDLADPARGVTLNVAPVWGGTRPNVIAAEAGGEIDLRVPDAAAGEQLTARLRALAAVDPRCRVAVEGGMNRPPFAETEAIRALHARAAALAATIGFDLPKEARGGGSDGNFTAALGVPTLDGLGCPGAGAHAAHEHILWPHLAPRAALLAGLLEELDA